MDFQQGAFIYINKPYGMSSFGALAYVRTRLSRRLHVKRIKTGHSREKPLSFHPTMVLIQRCRTVSAVS